MYLCNDLPSKAWLVTVQRFICLKIILHLIVNYFFITFNFKGGNREICLPFLASALTVFYKKVVIDNLKFRRICIKFSVSWIAVIGTLSSRKFSEIWFIPETLGTSTFSKPLTPTGTQRPIFLNRNNALLEAETSNSS